MRLTDDEIIKIAFVTALIGILFLMLLPNKIKEDNEKTFTMVNNGDNGVVKIKARVIGLSYSDDRTKLRLSFNTNITAITKEQVKLRKGDEIIVSGHLSKNILFIDSMDKIK